MAALTRKMQAFCAEKARRGNGRGTGLVSARAAGYTGSDAVVKSRASKLMADPRIRAEIARLRKAGREAAAELAEGNAREVEVPALTLARKLLLLAELAEDQTAKDSDRIKAIELASKLDGDLGGAGGDVEAVAAAAAQASANATVVVWVGNGRGPQPGTDDG